MKFSAFILIALSAVMATPAMAGPGKTAFRVLPPSYTAANAPDGITRAVLEKPLRRLVQNNSRDAASNVHANFPQIIEQNFARYDARNAAWLIDHLTANELADLAYLYNTAVADTRHPARLLDVLAARLDAQRLSRVSDHFGFAPLYEAVLRQAPAKATAFALRANVNVMAPATHTAAFGLYGSHLSNKVAAPNVSPAPFLGYTPYEIYLSFRTAPAGALGVSGALYETGMLLGQSATGSFFFGYAVGTMLAPVIEYYAPTLWDAIGGTLYEIFAPMRDTLPNTFGRADAEITVANSFGMPDYIGSTFESTGGDYRVVSEWNDFYGEGGGGHCAALWCEMF